MTGYSNSLSQKMCLFQKTQFAPFLLFEPTKKKIIIIVMSKITTFDRREIVFLDQQGAIS